ncbi:ADP-ribosylation factor-like protein [soil metagenome]
MALVDIDNRSIRAKIVYYGPARSGKSTNLRAIRDLLPADSEIESAGLDDGDAPTNFFDSVVVDAGDLSGFHVTFVLYSVSGQVGRDDARRAVLSGVDGVVFVADGTAGREAENVASLRELEGILTDLSSTDQLSVPVVIQVNKLDLERLAGRDEFLRVLNPQGLPLMLASALHQQGVVETLQIIARDVVRRV